MPNIQVNQKTLRAAITALELTRVPVYSARKLKGGTIEIITRFGVQTWKPKRKTTPRPAAGKTNTAPRAATSTRGGKPKSTKSRT